MILNRNKYYIEINYINRDASMVSKFINRDARHYLYKLIIKLYQLEHK